MGRIRELARANRSLLRTLVGCACVALVGFVVLWVTLLYQDVPVPREDKVPVAKEQILSPTELSETLAIFGPWKSPDVIKDGEAKVDARVLLMLQEDGGMRVASFRVYFPHEGWGVARPIEVSALAIERESVRLETNKGRDFLFNVAQPFILEQTPQMIYAVTADKKVWSLPLKEAIKLRYKNRE